MIFSASERVSCFDAMAMLSAWIVHGSVSSFEAEDFAQFEFESRPDTTSIQIGKISSLTGALFFVIAKVTVDINSKLRRNIEIELYIVGDRSKVR